MAFCKRFLDRRDRTVDRMVQAARSGKQNIVEASMASRTIGLAPEEARLTVSPVEIRCYCQSRETRYEP